MCKRIKQWQLALSDCCIYGISSDISEGWNSSYLALLHGLQLCDFERMGYVVGEIDSLILMQIVPKKWKWPALG